VQPRKRHQTQQKRPRGRCSWKRRYDWLISEPSSWELHVFFPINITLLTARLRMASNDHWIGRSGRRRWKGWRRRSGRRYGATRASWWPRRWRPTARSPPPASPCRKWRMSSSEHCYYGVCVCVCVCIFVLRYRARMKKNYEDPYFCLSK